MKQTEAVVQRCSVKKIFLEISQNSRENTCTRDSSLIKLQAACNFIKKTPLAQVFSCQFWEISKNSFFYRTPPVAASEQSCVSNMIWRQVKQRMVRVKLHIFLFHLKFVKMKKFILALKQPNSEKRIFAVCKYLRRLLKRILSPNFLKYSLSLWHFYDWLTPSQILILSNLILYNFILVTKKNSSVSKLFIFIRIGCVLNLHQNLCQYQIHNVM